MTDNDPSNDIEAESKSYKVQVAIPDVDVLESILERPMEGDEEEQQACEEIFMESLDSEEQELAALTSYAYWAWVHLESSADKEEQRTRYRKKMGLMEVQRHFVGANRNPANEDIVKLIKDALAWRKNDRIDLLKVCFNREKCVSRDNSTTVEIVLSEADYSHCEYLEGLIRTELMTQPMVTRGIDKEGRSVIVRLSRVTPWTDDEASNEAYLWGSYYTAERAFAVSEVHSRGAVGKITLISDYATYQSVNSPRLAIITGLLNKLQPMYPERLGTALLLDPPVWMTTLFTLLKPFLSASTAEKIAVVGSSFSSLMSWTLGSPTKDDVVRAIIDPSQAMGFMLEDAEQTEPVDVTKYLETVPFFEHYDSK